MELRGREGKLFYFMSMYMVGCVHAYFIFLLCAGKSGLLSRLFGSVDTEEVRELKVNLLDQRIQEGKDGIRSTQEELRYI